MKHIILFLCLITIGFGSHAQLSLQFVPNEGQWDAPFLYKGISASADIYLENEGITFVVGESVNAEKVHQYKHGEIKDAPKLRFHTYKIKWLNTTQKSKQVIPSKKQSFYHNYFLGSNPSAWKSKVGVYGNVDYQDLYDNIDLHIGSDKGNTKYDFIVKPGGNIDNIALAYEGVLGMQLDKGNLIIKTSVGDIQEMAPYAYQYVNGERKEVPCKFVLKNNQITFDFPKGYDKRSNLVIDPVIEFATLTGSTSDNWGFTATYDKAGNFYAGGIVNGSTYPTTTGAFELTYGGGAPMSGGLPCDMAITKFNSSGDDLIYSTFIGGSNNEMPHSMIVDTAGNLIIAGKTYSTNYPVTTGAYDTSANGGADIVVTKLNADGSDLIGSTYIGGSGDDGINISSAFSAEQTTIKYNYGDNSRSEVIVDKGGNIYVASSSRSTDFPVTSTAAKSSMTDSQDGVVFKLNPSVTTLAWSSYVGGSDDDAAYVLALDTAQKHLYVAGGTKSTNMFTTAMSGGLYDDYQGGAADGYILRFANGGTYALENATYIGTSAYDQCYGVQIDLENSVYAMGQTLGSFPVSTGVYSNTGSPQFLIKLDSTLSTRTYSTVWGSGASTKPNISPVAFLVDTCQNVYISGWGGVGSSGSTTTGLPITSDALQSTTDGNDFYFIVFDKNAVSLLYASFFGAAGKSEHVDGGTSRFDPKGVVYQAICASCAPGSSAFPATPGAWSSTKGSSSTNCNLGAVKIAFNLGSVDAEAGASPTATGCAPLLVNFSNESSNATSYEWNFADGGTSTLEEPTHTFTEPGVYNVRMIAINPNACKVRDTVFLTITVSDANIDAGFDYTLIDTCEDFSVSFVNTSTAIAGGSLSTATFQWFFGDDTGFTGVTPPVHNYPGTGTYDVMLIMTDPEACNSPDTVIKTITIRNTFVEAGISLPDTCLSGAITFTSTSTNGSTYSWSFGDGGTSSEESPVHEYAGSGSYTVTLIVTNPASCNGADTVTRVANIFPIPIASFNSTPLMPEANVPTTFVNHSTGATIYNWTFGDGGTSTEENPVHQYQRSGDYQVCLTAINPHGCRDKICKTVTADVRPLIDVPTAFTPNGDGTNDILYVRGYGIEKMEFRLFNRWGEMVFESTSQSIGWDGTFRGKPHEMDAFAYTLSATFLDGKSVTRKGNVTLIR